MRKPPRSDLRNEGWHADELDTMFSADVFRDPRADPADYWIHVICALTGARVSEVADMKRADVSERWGMWTFFLARVRGKTKESRRIIPIPETITSLGWLDYLGTVPKDGPLFPGNNGRSFSTAAGRLRKRIGLKRDGCDIHAFRHHMKTDTDHRPRIERDKTREGKFRYSDRLPTLTVQNKGRYRVSLSTPVHSADRSVEMGRPRQLELASP